jgi:hypothetical protein
MKTKTPVAQSPSGDAFILSLAGRWDWVGIVVWQDENTVTLTKPHNLRVWGTKSGIGQLASGPTASTVTDPAGEYLIVGRSQIVFMFQTDKSAWPCLK